MIAVEASQSVSVQKSVGHGPDRGVQSSHATSLLVGHTAMDGATRR